jgi:hypothetical protein
MPDLIHLVYTSVATQPMKYQNFLELLIPAREKNHRLGITGMLLYQKGSFLQVLEGRKTVVETLFREIVADPRHTNITLLVKHLIDAPEYSNWDMKFTNIDTVDLGKLPRFSSFSKHEFSLRNFELNDFTYVLLSAFRDM